MAQMKKVQFGGIPQHVLSKHLRQQGIKVERVDVDKMFLRTDKDCSQIEALAKQLPGAIIEVSAATKHEARA